MLVIGTNAGGILTGFNDDDVIIGRGGDDDIYANGGNDRVFAGAGDDIVTAGEGDDLVYGDSGNDELRGGDGNDNLFGGTGDDILAGQQGLDNVTGGTGADTFVLTGRYDTEEVFDAYGMEGISNGTTITDLDMSGEGDNFFMDGFSNAMADAGLLGQRIENFDDFVDFVNASGGVTEFQNNSVVFTITDDDGDVHAVRLMGYDADDFAVEDEEIVDGGYDGCFEIFIDDEAIDICAIT